MGLDNGKYLPQPPQPAAKASAAEKAAAPADYKTRLAELKERYAHLELQVPDEAHTWTPEELENYFESDGFYQACQTWQKGARVP